MSISLCLNCFRKNVAHVFRQLLLLACICSLPERAESANRNQSPDQSIIEKELRAGNVSILDDKTGEESLPLLYNLLLLAERNQFGEKSSSVQSMLVQRIAATPGHAKYLASSIESRSLKPGGVKEREKAFTLMTLVGSKEALAELGRFLFDDRDPEREIAEKLSPTDRTFSVLPNSLMAANGLGRILGQQSPVYERPGFYGPEEVRKIREWWKSSEGEAFRTKFTGSTHSGEPPVMAGSTPVTHVPDATSASSQQAKNPAAQSPPGER